MKNIAILSFVLVLVVAGVANSATTTVTYQVSASSDDGFAQSAAVQDTTSAFLKIGDERTYAVPYQMSAMRFNNVNIPRSATITSAYLKISSINTDYRGQIYGVIAAEASDNPADFSGRMIGNAALTTASVAWDYKTAWSPDTQYISPDISNAIQEVVNRSGFGSGNSIAIYYSTRALSGKGRSFASYEYNPASAAVLEVTYETYTISGHILTTEATPIEGVFIDAGADIEGDVTDATGYYEIKVPPGWSGSVSAKKVKWDITPQSYSYNQLTADVNDQDYIANYLGIIIVKADGTGDYPTIQAAIDAAVNGDVVVLQPGTFTGNGNRDIDFKGKAITVRGATGDPNDCIIDCNGTQAEPHRGFKFVSGETSNSTLEAMTITNGYRSHGGAIYTYNSGPSIQNCTIKSNSGGTGAGIETHGGSPSIYSCIIIDNTADVDGGGFYCESGSPTIINCTISSNSARGGSGLCLCQHCYATVNNCLIIDNSASDKGGGIYIKNSDPIITNCTISNNSTHNSAPSCGGGGIHNYYSSSPTISDCEVSNNSANYAGGGIYNWHRSSPSIRNCIISNNSAAYYGGGVYNWDDSSPSISNCIISNNLAADNGGGIFNRYYSCASIKNSTIRNNSATTGSGIGSDTISYCNLYNCIIWSNLPYQINGSANLSYCDIQGGYSGVGNINEDPLFVDDYHISLASPCFDAGDPNYVAEPNETDIDGNPRVVGRIDMGADEYTSDLSHIFLSEQNFNFQAEGVNSNPLQQNLTITNYGRTTLNWHLENICEWIDIMPLSASLGTGEVGNLTVDVDPNRANYGMNTCQLVVVDPDAENSPQIVTVNLEVLRPQIGVNNTDFYFTAYGKSDTSVAGQELVISNAGYDTLNWHISGPNDCNWLSAFPVTGQLNTGESNEVEITINPNIAGYGTHSCQLQVTAPGAENSPQTVTVNLEVLGPFISIDPNKFDITVCGKTGDVNDILFSIFNAGYDTLNWQIEVPDCNWLTVSPLSGQSANEPNTVTIAVDTNFVEYGQQSCQLIVTADDADNSPQVVTVNLEVLGPQIGVNKTNFNFTAYGKSDTTVAGQELVITNTGFDTLNWHIEVLDCNWLGIAPQSGQVTDGNSIVALTVDPNKAPEYGYNYATINIVDENASNSPGRIPVYLQVWGPSMYVNPPWELYIYAESNTVVEETFEISNTGYDILHWDIEILEDCNWLETVEPLSGECTAGESEEVTVTIDTSGLENNDYHTELLIHGVPIGIREYFLRLNLIVCTPDEIHVPRDYPTIQAAINAAVDGDEVIVAPGTYTGEGNKDIDFLGKAITVRSENGPESCIIDIRASQADWHNGFYFRNGENRSAVVEGFTITGGYTYQGGGVFCDKSSPTIKNCIITKNISGWGGGIAVANSNASIVNCLISENEAWDCAGGIFNWYHSNITITNCTIAANRSQWVGAILCYSSNANVNNCILWANTSPSGKEFGLHNSHGTGSSLTLSYSNILGGESSGDVDSTSVLNWGPGNIDADPCFAEAGFWHPNDTPLDANDDFWVQGDYHLKSQAGRWKPSIYIGLDPTGDGFIDLSDFAALASFWCEKGGSLPADLDNSGFVDFADLFLLLDNYLMSYSLGAWVFDDVNSPCIDAGDPVSDWTEELWPHGKHINMGAYGGTPQASMSLLTVGNKADLNNDGFVNAEDLALFVEMWLVDDLLLAENINRNGLVNSPDFAEFAGQWLWEE